MDGGLCKRAAFGCVFQRCIPMNNKNNSERGDAQVIPQAMLAMAILFFALAGGAVFVWPGMVTPDTAGTDALFGVILTVVATILFVLSRK